MTLRWGLLGTARINRLLIPAIRASARSVIAAVGSRDGARASAYAQQWDIPLACPSYDDLLAAPIDIVYNALPNTLHVPWSIRAVAAGRHVLCEKPLGLSAADVDDLTARVAATGMVVTEGFMYRHHAQTAAILSILRGGVLGELREIVSGFTYIQDRPGDVRLVPSLGGGALWDIGCYPVSIAQLLAGAPIGVTGHQQVGPTGIDDAFTGSLTYANGVIAHVEASFKAPYRAWLRVVGRDGTLDVERPFRPGTLEHLRLQRKDRVDTITVTGNEIFVDEVLDMEDAVLGIRAPRLSLAESRLHADTLAKLYESAGSGDDVCTA